MATLGLDDGAELPEQERVAYQFEIKGGLDVLEEVFAVASQENQKLIEEIGQKYN